MKRKAYFSDLDKKNFIIFNPDFYNYPLTKQYCFLTFLPLAYFKKLELFISPREKQNYGPWPSKQYPLLTSISVWEITYPFSGSITKMVKLSTSILGRSLDNFQVQTLMPKWLITSTTWKLPISYNKMALRTQCRQFFTHRPTKKYYGFINVVHILTDLDHFQKIELLFHVSKI